MDDEFYIGYLTKAPPKLARVTRKRVLLLLLGSLGTGAMLAATLAYAGDGLFEFGTHRQFRGSVLCGPAPVLTAMDRSYVLVGYGKNRAPVELCGGPTPRNFEVEGTLIEREGRALLEVASFRKASGEPQGSAPVSAPIADVTVEKLGRFTLQGEIVDSKCYFGVMNPAEGRVHRACAELCLRGGVPAVFVVRDRTGATIHLLLAGRDGTSINEALLPWVASPVELAGEVARQGQWLVMRIDPQTIRGL